MHRNRVPTQWVRAAFTLIELLVVIAIIAIIAAILFPVFARARGAARKTVCLSYLKQIGSAVLMYVQDYDEKLPFVLNFSANDFANANIGDNGKRPVVPGVTGQEPQFQLVIVVAPYVKNQSVWYCPSVGSDYMWEWAVEQGFWKKGATMRIQGTTYRYTYLAWPFPYVPRQESFMGGKSYSLLREPSRWPMLGDEPDCGGFIGSLGDRPSRAVPHSGGLNVAYGDGHAKYQHVEAADECYLATHNGDGLYAGQ